MAASDESEVGPLERLKKIASEVQESGKPALVTVRTFLSWFGAKRRGSWIVREIRKTLRRSKLRTDPDFVDAYVDSEISLILADSPKPAEHSDAEVSASDATPSVPVSSPLLSGALDDPTYRISRLPAANHQPLSVKPDDPLAKAMTMMMVNQFSQLPVMTTDTVVKGMVSWTSIGSSLAQGGDLKSVADCMVTPYEVSASESIFVALGTIVTHDYVLVRGKDRRITGIVTSTDLNLQFHQLAEPFLLLGEIENHIRRLLDGKVPKKQLEAALEVQDGRDIKSVHDLNFGEYIRLCQNPDIWPLLKLPLDSKVLTSRLDKIREIRNDVMHFDPEPLEDADLALLRSFVRFLRSVGKPESD